MHFTSRLPALGQIRFDFLLIIVLAIMAIIQLASQQEVYRIPISRALLVFIFFCFFSIPLVKWPGSVINHGLKEFIKGVVFFFFTVSFIDNKKRLFVFLSVFLGCQLFRAFEPAYLHYTEGYWGDFAYDNSGEQLYLLDRLSGAPNDIINPNQLAWVINTTFPFIYYIGLQHKKKIVQIVSLVLVCCLLYPLLLTGSRSGIVCIFVIVLGIIYLGPNKIKRLSILLLGGLPIALVAMHLLSPDMAERYLSLVDSSAVGASSAAGRIDGLIENIKTVTNIHGIFGHGLGTSLEVNVQYLGSALYAHNLYIEALQEVGLVGLILFLRYIYYIIRGIRSVGSGNNDLANLSQLLKALKVWIFMDLIYSISCFGLNSWEWYLFGGVSAVCLRLVKSNSPLPHKPAISKSN